MKHGLSLLVLLLLAVAIPLSAQNYDFSAVAPSGQTLYYDISGSSATVTYPGSSFIGDYDGYTRPTGSLEIPESVMYNGTTYSVTSIGGSAFDDCSGLYSVTIPISVTSIGHGSFDGCSGLYSVTIPNSVTSIYENPFSGCRGLTSITVESGNTVYDSRENCNAIIETATNNLQTGCKYTVIPNSVISIGRIAFDGCTNLSSITIPSSVTSIGEFAFNGCTNLSSITIPSSVTSIGHCAFQSCSRLTSLTIPNSVTSIGSSAFSSCSGLTSITVESGNTVYDSRENCNAIIETSSNTLLQGCKNTVIPNSVTSIGQSAFLHCSDLRSITIPNSVISIGEFAFCYSSLRSITIPNSVIEMGRNAFDDCRSLTTVTIGNSVTSIGWATFADCSSLTSVTIPNSVTSIGGYAFMDCSSLTSLTIPNSVTTIGASAFSHCSGLTTITIPSQVYDIDNEAFKECTGLTSITCLAEVPPTLHIGIFTSVPTNIPLHIPCGSETAYQSASQWNRFTNIQCISQSVTTDTMDIRTCTGQTLLFEVNDGNHTAKVIGYVGSCTGSLTVPAWFSVDGERYEVTAIGANAFENCTGLESVILPRSITLVDTEAFKGCTALVTVDMK